ncbi:MAG: FeoB small GTPase domain-containing protein, partial [Candidatus Glassbacteria bacterium]
MKRTYTYPEKDAEKHKDFHEDSRKTVILVGNPNVGKSVIFSLLTRSYVMVSNYPGTTVEFTRGVAQFDDWQGSIIDSPGVNSFIPSSEDEKVTRDIVLHGKTDGILQIADAKNLRRA